MKKKPKPAKEDTVEYFKQLDKKLKTSTPSQS
jgi:hypothetical protein